MGFMLPSPESPREAARGLIARKDAIEAELSTQVSILKANSGDMTTPLIDAEGFPRADLDIYTIRQARARIIELRNDLSAVMIDISKALEKVYDPALSSPTATSAAASQGPAALDATTDENLQPFARVDGVAPQSPASEAGLRREDLIIKFGHLTKASFSAESLQPLAQLVSVSENRELRVQVLRDQQVVTLNFRPRSGWGGRGMLGCHIVPFNVS